MSDGNPMVKGVWLRMFLVVLGVLGLIILIFVLGGGA